MHRWLYSSLILALEISPRKVYLRKKKEEKNTHTTECFLASTEVRSICRGIWKVTVTLGCTKSCVHLIHYYTALYYRMIRKIFNGQWNFVASLSANILPFSLSIWYGSYDSRKILILQICSAVILSGHYYFFSDCWSHHEKKMLFLHVLNGHFRM